MEIKSLTVADVEAALLSGDFWLTETLPITKHKALSFIRNPRADKGDLVLLIAYQAGQVVGYIGILPDNIFVDDAVYKLGWLTSWWVDPCVAAKGVGAALLYKALNAYHQHVGVSGGSKEARKVLNASHQFIAVNPLKGLDVRLRFDVTRAILRKFPAMKPFRLLFKIIDAAIDEVVNLRRALWERRNTLCRHLTFEYISSIDEETARFIQAHHRQDLTRKGKADLDWMMAYPWILSAPSKDSASRRYFFSSLSDRFSYLAVKVLERRNGMAGFFILNVRNDRMSVVYSYFGSQQAASIAAAVVHHALAMDVGTLSIFDDRLVERFSELDCPRWSTQTVSRGFFLSKAFADIPLSDHRLHGGDGDFAFY
jgi:hypothetical protein